MRMPSTLSDAVRGRQTTPMNRIGAEKQSKFRHARGFTLLELMIVVTIIMILATIVAARYKQSVDNAREAVLKDDLWTMREAIQNYASDKGQYPSSLDDLKAAGYINDVPIDPITRQRDWTTKSCDEVLSVDQTSTAGVCEVHSGSSASSPFSSTPYSTW
jgi:general secretion pathway protein G